VCFPGSGARPGAARARDAATGTGPSGMSTTHDVPADPGVPAGRAALAGERPAAVSVAAAAAVITRLTETWKAGQRAFAARDLSAVDYVYLWADGIHVNIRLEGHRLCLLVMIGVRADGRKELIALADGYRESTESWADLLRDCGRRGMRTPVLAAGDRALGSGTRCARSSPRPKSSAAGSTRQETSWPCCPSLRIPGRRRPRRGRPAEAA
jgi:putative transposase